MNGSRWKSTRRLRDKCVCVRESESWKDYSAIFASADWSDQPVAPRPDEALDRWMSASASWAFYALPPSPCNWKSSSSVLSWDFSFSFFAPPRPPFPSLSTMRLQNRKTNSGKRPPNVINFLGVGGWVEEGEKGVEEEEEEGEREGRLGTIIAGGRILISCRFLPVWLAWPWPITSELCVTVSLPVLPKEWTGAGTAERRPGRSGERKERRGEKEKKTKRDTPRWGCRSINRTEKGEKKKKGRKKWKRGLKSLARSEKRRHEGTYVLYPPNIEHDMWFTKEMKGFWRRILSMLEMFSGGAWNCAANMPNLTCKCNNAT